MTTFRDFFTPTLLGVVVVLPPGNAQAVNDQILLCRGGPDTLSLPQTNSLDQPALEILALGQESPCTGDRLDEQIGQHLSLHGDKAQMAKTKTVESTSEVSQSASSSSKPVEERWEKEKSGYLVKSSTTEQLAKAGAEPQQLTHADAVAPANS